MCFFPRKIPELKKKSIYPDLILRLQLTLVTGVLLMQCVMGRNYLAEDFFLNVCFEFFVFPSVGPSAVGWACRIHRLYLCRGLRSPPQWVSWIWHETIWWWGSSNARAFANAKYPSLPSLPSSLWPGVVAFDRVLSMGKIELFDL